MCGIDFHHGLNLMLMGLDMLHFLANVRQSMLACRRTQPIPQDFLQSLHLHQLSLRSLLPHLEPPVPPSKSQFSLPLDDAAPDSLQQQLPNINFALTDKSKITKSQYIPKSLPAFPSEHTYRATPNVPVRENDPRKIREQAIEEGRQGEAALRKLVSARTDNTVPPGLQANQRRKSMRTIRDEVWKEAMEDSMAASDHTQMDIDGGLDQHNGMRQAGRYGPAVNADRKHWRKPATSRTAKLTQGS